MVTTAEMVTIACGGATSTILIQLTQQDGTNSIDSTVLGAAATKAEGMFRRITGIEPDADLDWQEGPLLAGTLYWLEFAKGRDSEMLKTRKEVATEEMEAVRGQVALEARTDSNLDPREEPVGARPDLDRDGFVGGYTDGAIPTNRDPFLQRSPTNDRDV